jgi:propionate CoA-transferase
MRIIDRILLAARIVRWRLTWSRRDLDARPPGDLDDRFMSAREAAGLVPDGACCLSTGMAGNARCSTLFWAIRERFEAGGHPRNLTWIAVGGQGGRGRAPGTVEEVGLKGLVTRFISGHVETTRSMLALAEAGRLELHVMAQGEMCFALEAQATATTASSAPPASAPCSTRAAAAARRSPRAPASTTSRAPETLRFRLPKLDVAVISAPWADAAGNVYFHDAATITENREAARAAKANGGRVLVSVAGVIPADPGAGQPAGEDGRCGGGQPAPGTDHPLPAARLLAAVHGRRGRRRRGRHRETPLHQSLPAPDARCAGPVECALARLGAHVFARSVSAPACVNIGVGFGEEVCRELYQSALRPSSPSPPRPACTAACRRPESISARP